MLLDNDMVAHVGDFGLATFLFEESSGSPQQSTMSGVLKGSIGYIPPGMFFTPYLYFTLFLFVSEESESN